MCRSRLDDARQKIVACTEEAAENAGLDVTLASNTAYDLATQDSQLITLCRISDDLASFEREHRETADRRVKAKALNAGIDVDAAIEARTEQLVDAAIETARDHALEADGVSA